jgi:hypothetical protein
VAEFWQKRIGDLASLKSGEFARRNKVPVYVVLGTRKRLLGESARPVGWWHKPEFLEILRSNVPLRVMGEKLGVSISHAYWLKYRVLHGSNTIP